MTQSWRNNIQEKMKSVWNRIEEHYFFTAIAVNAVFLILAILFCEIKYETSDDYIMAAIISGAYTGTPNPHMIFINILWGYLLLPLYYLIPQISWYLIAQLALCFCSFTALTYLLMKKLNVIIGLMISILLITFFSDDTYIMVQFTKTAILAVMSGSILLLYALFHKSLNRKREMFLGAILVFLGSLIRFNVIYIAGGFLFLILMIEFIRILFIEKDRIRKGSIQVVIVGVILLVTVFGAKKLDSFIYSLDKEYSYFRAYGNARGNIVDKKDYGYDICAEEYQEIGLSENDYRLLRSWNFGDPDFYTLERMQSAQKIISDYQSTLELDKKKVEFDLRERNYWTYPSLWACVILFLLSIIFNKRYWWASFLSAGIGFLYLYYFAASGRTVYRIEYAIFLCVFLTIIYFWDRENCRKFNDNLETWNICVILITLLFVYQAPTYNLNNCAKLIYGEEYKNYIEDIFFDSWNYDSRRYRCSIYNEDAFSELQKEVEGNPGNFYFLNFATTIQTLYLDSSPWGNEQKSLWENSSYLAGVDINFPDVLKLLKEKHVENPLKSLGYDNIYLVDNFYQEEVLKYIQEHYYPEAKMELYKTIDGFQIWKFYKN